MGETSLIIGVGVAVIVRVFRLVLVAALVAPVSSLVLAELPDDVSAMILRGIGGFLANRAFVFVHVVFGSSGVACVSL